MSPAPLITNDAVVLGLLSLLLGAVFWTSSSPHPFWRRFYGVVPALLLCYFLPALFNSLGVIDGEHSQLYPVASRYLLPATLVLLTLSIDLKAILRLGPKALILFLTGTAGVILGGPLALLVWHAIDPAIVEGEVWRGMTAIAGSWIGGGANQAAMKEVFAIGNDLFGMMVAVDVIVANIWMAVLLFLAGRAETIDARRGADTAALIELRRRMQRFEAEHARIPALPDLMFMLAIGFGCTGLAHALATPLAAYFDAQGAWAQRLSLSSSFFWIVVLATTFGLLLSFTRARLLEGPGASKIGSAMLYVLVASIGMHMDLRAVFSNPGLFGVGLTWIAFHAALLLIVARLLKAPVFYMAIGSQANIGGAASAPVVASAFHPSLAPVGVLLAVLGYALGTYGAWLCGQLLRVAAG
ncbi:DUF819 family protein [Fontimonas sp. SYSU GA230001]|uniref:DUF819 family protein n=1 Tax=Fontimonas sp. SYSU GA230001 TaxID=3142450 RepID=UPI0032B4E069